jgi:hypothetical protein
MYMLASPHTNNRDTNTSTPPARNSGRTKHINNQEADQGRNGQASLTPVNADKPGTQYAMETPRSVRQVEKPGTPQSQGKAGMDYTQEDVQHLQDLERRSPTQDDPGKTDRQQLEGGRPTDQEPHVQQH